MFEIICKECGRTSELTDERGFIVNDNDEIKIEIYLDKITEFIGMSLSCSDCNKNKGEEGDIDG